MFARNEQGNTTALERYVRALLQRQITGISADNITFLDEVYRVLARRLAGIGSLGTTRHEYIHGNSLVDYSLFEHMYDDISAISDLSFQILPELYQELTVIADQIVSTVENLSRTMSVCENYCTGIEYTLKRKNSQNAVKDEVFVYDRFTTDTRIAEGSLTIDRRAGAAYLQVISAKTIPFTIIDSTVNRGKGIFTKPVFRNETKQSIGSGYYHSRMYADIPAFEIDTDRDTTTIQDGDLESAYLIEYSSYSKEPPLEVVFNLDFAGARINALNITADPGTMQSVLSSNLIVPYLQRCLVRTSDTATDIIDRVADRRVVVGETVMGTIDPQITPNDIDLYPNKSVMVNMQNVQSIGLALANNIPQEIYYPEKIVYNDEGLPLYRFNYFETLVMNGYEPPRGRTDPRSWYSDDEMRRMYHMIESSASSADEKVRLYRYFIALKEITAYEYTFAPASESITGNLNQSDRDIASVELFVNESCPEGTGFLYYISHDKITWHEILPKPKRPVTDIPYRIVYNGIDTRDDDLNLSLTSSSVYLKIAAYGSAAITPVLNSYGLRIKLQ